MIQKVTKKFIKENFSVVLKVNYCKLQFLLETRTPDYYIAGKEGWYADVYDLGDGAGLTTAICTGYKPFGNITPSKCLCQHYNSLALKARIESNDMKEYSNKLNELLDEFLDKAFIEAFMK